MNGLVLCGTGRCLPSQRVTNEDLSARLDTSDEWIRSRSGIVDRYYCTQETGTQLATEAGRRALAAAGIRSQQLGAVIVATVSPDWTTPATACLVAAALGTAEDIPCFDLAAACSGFVYGLRVAQGLLQPDRPYALVVGCEVLSRVMDHTDRSTCVLFGDGAGAAVVRLQEGAPFAATLGARGNLHALSVGGPGVPYPQAYLKMDGKEVFRFAVETMPRLVNRLLEQTGSTLDEVDWVVCHQANSRIIDSAIKRLKADPAKFYKNMQRYGNTSSATIPIALDELVEQKKLLPGGRALCVGFGGGLTWAGAYLCYQGKE